MTVELAAAFTRRLHGAGLPVTPDRGATFTTALALTEPVARRRVYWVARACFVSDRLHVATFDRVFREVFGSLTEVTQEPDATIPADALVSGGAGEEGDGDELLVPTLASEDETLRDKSFAALTPAELASLYRLMAQLKVATPVRRTRRAVRRRHGQRVDVRRTLRDSLHTGGHPVRLARRQRRIERRRLVLLCDISGSMEPYARAYLQFLAAAGSDAEAFVFATRLTRVTRALAAKSPQRALQRAAAAAPDWSSGTRIGDALREFNDRHGRRGMARGAVVVILSDGWERGDPALVEREMQRLARLAHRIVWVNPRVAASEFAPRVGGMAAALPYVDALVSGHSFAALGEVAAAIGAEQTGTPPELPALEEEEPWASATPVAGSSVAMPTGYGPKRGKTEPGW